MSIGPWPMSVLPCQVPTSDFIFSNSADPGLAFGRSSARAQTAAARIRVEQIAINFVFIVGFGRFVFVYLFSSIARSFMSMTNKPSPAGQWVCTFLPDFSWDVNSRSVPGFPRVSVQPRPGLSATGIERIVKGTMADTQHIISEEAAPAPSISRRDLPLLIVTLALL